MARVSWNVTVRWGPSSVVVRSRSGGVPRGLGARRVHTLWLVPLPSLPEKVEHPLPATPHATRRILGTHLRSTSVL